MDNMNPMAAPINVDPPIVAPAPAATPLPTQTPAPQFGGGGKLGGKFFEGVSLVDVGMIALATLGIFTVVYCYHKHLDIVKTQTSALQKKVEELEVNVVNMTGGEYKRM